MFKKRKSHHSTTNVLFQSSMGSSCSSKRGLRIKGLYTLLQIQVQSVHQMIALLKNIGHFSVFMTFSGDVGTPRKQSSLIDFNLKRFTFKIRVLREDVKSIFKLPGQDKYSRPIIM